MIESVLVRLNDTSPNDGGLVWYRNVFEPHLRPESPFMTRVKSGQVMGEYAPQYTPENIGDVNVDNICVKINHVFISDGYVMGLIEPFGPQSQQVQDRINNREFVRLGMRARVQTDSNNPTVVTKIDEIFAFDLIA